MPTIKTDKKSKDETHCPKSYHRIQQRCCVCAVAVACRQCLTRLSLYIEWPTPFLSNKNGASIIKEMHNTNGCIHINTTTFSLCTAVLLDELPDKAGFRSLHLDLLTIPSPFFSFPIS